MIGYEIICFKVSWWADQETWRLRRQNLLSQQSVPSCLWKAVAFCSLISSAMPSPLFFLPLS